MGDVRLKNPVTEPLTPDFIPSLQQPRQQVLWVGCSDSSDFTETSLLNLLPDEMLVHRNIGNMVINGDLSCETTVKYAVAALQVGLPWTSSSIIPEVGSTNIVFR